jgi:hypothetical protein
MKVRVVSGRSSTRAPQISTTYLGTKVEFLEAPDSSGLNVNADKNSIFFNGRFMNAIQPKMHFTLSSDL